MCKILISTLGLSHEEWLCYRKQGIGGSDAGAVCGLNPYVSPIQVFLDKTSKELSQEAEQDEKEAMRVGRDLEEYVARRFTEASGLKVRRKNAILFQENYPFMLANVDRMIVGEKAGLECKTASPYSADKWNGDNVPEHYLIQCHHYMAVTGTSAWYLAVLILGKEFKYVRIERDEEIISYLRQIEETFWKEHVLKNIMPNPDGSKAAEEIIKRYFSHSIPDSSIRLKEEFNEKLKRREELLQLMGRLSKEQSQIEQEVKLYMNEHEAAENEDFIVTWKNYVSKKLDTARLKKEVPEIYQKYLQTSNSRRFSVRTA